MKNLPRRFLPSYSVLRSFEAAARHESFTLAAEELHLTQSAISRQVKELEMTVGAELFRRIGRRVMLTMAGKNLASDLAADLENIRRTMMRAISAGEMRAALRVASLPAFASRWLIPRLPSFSQQHPEIEINVSTRFKPFDLNSEHFDLAIHFGKKDWPDTDMTPLCSETMVPVASPVFRSRHAIETVEDLVSVPRLHLTTRPMAWQEFFHTVNLRSKFSLNGKYFDQFSMVIAGAVASLGAALIPTYLIENELRSGALVELSAIKMTTTNHYFLVTPVNQKEKPAKTFCDWLVSNFNEPMRFS